MGSGIDIVPKTGDKCIALKSKGNVFVIGFKLPAGDRAEGIEIGNRLINLPQGSMALRAVAEDGSEAHLILSAGGSAIIGSSDTCRTLYSSIDGSVLTLFNNWEIIGPGGFVKWSREGDSTKVKYHATYRTDTLDDDELIVNVSIGESDKEPMSVSATAANGRTAFKVSVDEFGEATISGDSINIIATSAISIDAPNLTIKNRQVLGQGDPF